MAERELSILVRAKGALQAARDIGSVDKSVGGLGQTAGRVGKGAAILTGAAVGAVAIVVGRSVRSGLESLAELEDAESSVQGAITQAGLAGQVSAKQVSGWANEIESSIEAAFDDKAITQAASTLIRFGKVTPSNLKPALVVMTDLATKTGDIDSAASLLAKALADPAKAAGKLARVGIVLTKSQQDQIKAFMKAGDAASAQKLILDALAVSTAGAAKASAGPYRDSLNILTDVTEDAQRALATGFLPVITKVRDLLSTELAKPQTLANIKQFGEGLAGGLETLIDTARGLPWDSIGAALQLGGIGAKAILDAFTGMPPWVQTAIITGWGLNKVSGGAVTGIIGELGKGLIKGVLGMNAGVVNINAGVVNGTGAGGGIPPVGAPAGGPTTTGAGSLIQALGVAVAGFKLGQDTIAAGVEKGVIDANGKLITHREGNQLKLGPGVESAIKGISPAVTAATIRASDRADTLASQVAAAQASRDSLLLGSSTTLTAAARAGLSGVISQVSAAKAATVSAASSIAAATRSANAATTQAVKDKDLSVAVHTTIPITQSVVVTNGAITKAQTTQKRISGYLS